MSKNAQAGLAAALVALLVGALIVALLGGEDPDPTPFGAPSGQVAGSASPQPRPNTSPSQGLGTPQVGGGGTGTSGTPTPGRTGAGGPNGKGPTTPYQPKRFGHQTEPGRGGAVAVVLVCTDGNGNALPGVRIEAKRRSGMPLTPVVTDGRGRATLGGLPEGETISGVARHAQSKPVSFGPVRVGPKTEIPLRFGRAALGRLVGTIQDDAGAPVTADAQLVLTDGAKGSKGSAVLDATALNLRPDGGFQADLAEGTYAVVARGKGLTESDTAYVTIKANETAGPIALTVRRQGSISGQVALPTDLQGQADLQLDLVLEITGGTDRNPYTKHDRRALKLDGANRFQLDGCDAGRYRVRLEVPQPGGNRVGPWIRFQLMPGKPVSGVRLNLTTVMVSVQGTVSDQNGIGVAGATVSIRGKQVTTDQEGRYALRGLSPGSLGVKASKAGFANDYKQVRYEGARLTVDLIINQHGSISGRVVAGQTKVANIGVVAVSKDDDGYLTHPGTTDGQGTYRIDGLAPGTYYLKAGPGARDPYSLDGAPSVTVKAGQSAKAPDVVLP